MKKPIIRVLGKKPYLETWRMMRNFTLFRDKKTQDEIWLVEHFPVFTQGTASRLEHIKNFDQVVEQKPAESLLEVDKEGRVKETGLFVHGIPVVQSDRGGQITYHGPGQIVMYILFDLHRLDRGVRQLVELLEKSVIRMLGTFSIDAHAVENAPGVYVDQKKICALGLRVRKNFTYHGLSINFKMDLTPFGYVDPCGYQGMEVTQLYDCILDEIKKPSKEEVEQSMIDFLISEL